MLIPMIGKLILHIMSQDMYVRSTPAALLGDFGYPQGPLGGLQMVNVYIFKDFWHVIYQIQSL